MSAVGHYWRCPQSNHVPELGRRYDGGIGYRKATCCRQRQTPPAWPSTPSSPYHSACSFCCNSATPPFTTTLLYFQPPCLHFSPSLFLSCSSPAYPLCSSLSAHLWSRLAFSTCQLADRPVFTPRLGHSKLHRTPQSALAWFHIRPWTTQLRCGLSIPSRLRSGSRHLHHLHHRPH